VAMMLGIACRATRTMSGSKCRNKYLMESMAASGKRIVTAALRNLKSQIDGAIRNPATSLAWLRLSDVAHEWLDWGQLRSFGRCRLNVRFARKRTRLGVIPVANSSRMPPSLLRASTRSRAWACGLRPVRRLASRRSGLLIAADDDAICEHVKVVIVPLAGWARSRCPA
jgi:hypothetical protein